MAENATFFKLWETLLLSLLTFKILKIPGPKFNVEAHGVFLFGYFWCGVSREIRCYNVLRWRILRKSSNVLRITMKIAVCVNRDDKFVSLQNVDFLQTILAVINLWLKNIRGSIILITPSRSSYAFTTTNVSWINRAKWVKVKLVERIDGSRFNEVGTKRTQETSFSRSYSYKNRVNEIS